MDTTNNESLSNANPRTRTSPRTKAFTETLALIDTHLEAWKLSAHPSSKSVTEVLTLIRHGVQTLVDQNEGLAPETTSGKRAAKGSKVEGTHFVGVKADGAAMYVNRNTDTTTGFEALHGPFNTKNGATYAAEHGTYTGYPQVF